MTSPKSLSQHLGNIDKLTCRRRTRRRLSPGWTRMRRCKAYPREPRCARMTTPTRSTWAAAMWKFTNLDVVQFRSARYTGWIMWFETMLCILPFGKSAQYTGWPWWFDTIFCWLPLVKSVCLPICHTISAQFSPAQTVLGRQRNKPNQSLQNILSNHHGSPCTFEDFQATYQALACAEEGSWREEWRLLVLLWVLHREDVDRPVARRRAQQGRVRAEKLTFLHAFSFGHL